MYDKKKKYGLKRRTTAWNTCAESEAVTHAASRVGDDGIGEVSCSFNRSVIHRAASRASPSGDLVVPIGICLERHGKARSLNERLDGTESVTELTVVLTSVPSVAVTLVSGTSRLGNCVAIDSCLLVNFTDGRLDSSSVGV